MSAGEQPKRESGDLHIRVPGDLWARLMRLRQKMIAKGAGAPVTNTRAALRALEKGLEVLGL